MAKKKRGPQSLIATGIFNLVERKDGAYIPLLQEKIAGLRKRIADKRPPEDGQEAA
jgi:hypothetical protein